VRRKLGCALFLVLGLAWLGFTIFMGMANSLGDCGSDDLCVAIKNAEDGRIVWRGIAVGLLLIIAYASYRRFFEDEDV
jgi:hypothetical protein